MNTNYNDLSIVIISCDSYLDILEGYLFFFNLNWPDCPFKRYAALETLQSKDEDTLCVNSGKGTTWSRRTIDAVKKAKTKYILLTVEDLYMSKKVNTNDFVDIIQFMKDYDIKYYRIPVFKTSDNTNISHPYNDNVELIKANVRYNVSIGTAVWDRDELLSILGEGKMSAWDLENYFSSIAIKSKPGYLEKYVSDKRFLFGSIHMVKSGKYIPSSVRKMKKLGYNIDYKKRGFISFSDRLRMTKIYDFIARKSSTRIRRFFKKILTFFGMKFTSDE